MEIEELYKKNEKHHIEIITMVEKLNKDVNEIKIKNGGGKHVVYNRDEFHQATYDTIHFRGLGGKMFKIIGVIAVILQMVIAFKILIK